MEKISKKNDIWNIFMYLIIYSIAGFFIETIFGIVTKGVIESRKSFLYGPFCAVYGVGATIMIILLKNQKKVWKIFLYGAIIGAIVEFLMSLFFEKFLGVKWWDYSNNFFNINGRTCLFYAVSWGILAIFLIKIINPNLKIFIENFKLKFRQYKFVISLFILFFIADAIFSGYALKIFYYRIAIENNLNIEKREEILEKYEQIKNKNVLTKFINKNFQDKKMLKNYPNIIIEEKDKKMVYVDSLFEDFDTYYYRLGIFKN